MLTPVVFVGTMSAGVLAIMIPDANVPTPKLTAMTAATSSTETTARLRFFVKNCFMFSSLEDFDDFSWHGWSPFHHFVDALAMTAIGAFVDCVFFHAAP